jgi:gamma-glutamyltranspeptidase/glutathione hydrolase
MVASAFPEATNAGVEMLAQGGNAIDASCAVGLAIGVCEPQASGLGGQTVGMVHCEDRTTAIDGSSRVPSLAHREQFETDDDRRIGYKAATVPSTLATFAWLHERYGKLPWNVIVEPSIRIARDGYQITQLQSELQARELENMLAVPSRSAAKYFLKYGEQPYSAGETFRQPELATLFELIARDGADAFYTGDVAAQIDADMRNNGGLLRSDDLAYVPVPLELRPLRRRYRQATLESMPPPGSGRTLLLVMMMLARLESKFLGGQSPSRYHFIAETFRKAFAQRLDRPYDRHTWPQVKQKTMLSREFAAAMAKSIDDEIDETLPIQDFPGEQVSDTTHFSVMDRDGNATAFTQSIELVYGSKAAADGLGFLYNNYMMALELDDPAHPYYLRPNAVPWSSATPTLVMRDGRPWMALGSPGSERIFSTVSQFLVHVIDGSQSMNEAMLEPRFHCSTGGTLSLEYERIDRSVVKHLRRLGYRIDKREPFAFYLGCVQAVLKRRTGEGFQGVADVRRDGTAAGPD